MVTPYGKARLPGRAAEGRGHVFVGRDDLGAPKQRGETMQRKRILALAVALCLLCGCALPESIRPAPPPTMPPVTARPTPTPAEKLTWLHGFYAISAYSQIGLTDKLDAVSLGWARMCFDPQRGPWVNTTSEGGNGWVVPQGSETVLETLKAQGTDHPLNVFTSQQNKTTLPDGTSSNVLVTVISEEYRVAAVDALVVASGEYSGLTIDFEGLVSAEYQDDFTDFMALLRRKLPEDKTLYVAVPPDAWYHGYDYRALGELCDRVILMAHDYQWQAVPAGAVGTEDTFTPLAPLPRVEEALANITDPDTGVADVSKVALALSFATVGVEVEEDADILKGDRLYNPGVQTLTKRLAQDDAEVGWDELSSSGYVFYHDEEGRRYKVWYESPESVAAKIDKALEYGVSGLSLWRLGAVPDEEPYDVWSVILEKAERG